ncbi:MAG: hypothetical protein SGPRY_006352 [Prymnesium sp.]
MREACLLLDRDAPDGSVVGVSCVPPQVGTPHFFAPAPIERSDAVHFAKPKSHRCAYCCIEPPAGGHRSIPLLCEQLASWCKPSTQRYAVACLGGVISANTLDVEAAVMLMFHCNAVPALLKVLRDECIYTLGMIARLGALPLLQPTGIFVNLIAGALLAPETRTKAYAAFFWQASPQE